MSTVANECMSNKVSQRGVPEVLPSFITNTQGQHKHDRTNPVKSAKVKSAFVNFTEQSKPMLSSEAKLSAHCAKLTGLVDVTPVKLSGCLRQMHITKV